MGKTGFPPPATQECGLLAFDFRPNWMTSRFPKAFTPDIGQGAQTTGLEFIIASLHSTLNN